LSQCPLAIKEYFITNLSIRANPVQDARPEAQVNVQAKAVSARNNDNKNLWRVSLNVTCTPTPGNVTPYFIEVEAVGFFEVADSCPPEKVEAMVSNWGPSMLYGAIRELVILVTSRGPTPHVVLPSFSFIKENAESETRNPPVASTSRIPSDITIEK
jgi:preprotein translocase subunit SecB